MNLQQLRYFLATCQHGSFAAAADALFLAQPSLADQVRRLEGELGVRLFVRSGRRLTLTEAGKTLVPHAERVLAAVELAASSVADVRHLRGGTASLGTFGVAYRLFVREVIVECVARHPDLKVRVVGQNTVEVCEKIREGELEAGLVTLPIDETGFDVRPVMTDEQLFAAVDGPEMRAPMTIERLAETRIINAEAHFGWRDPTRRRLTERARRAGVVLDAVIEVESLEAALSLAALGLGGTLVLRMVVEGAAFPDTLRTVSLDPPFYETFAFVHRSGTKLSPGTEELIRLTEQQIARFGRPLLTEPSELPREAGDPADSKGQPLAR
jgi:DNA-binding transcriptional LysR family regulator